MAWMKGGGGVNPERTTYFYDTLAYLAMIDSAIISPCI